MNRWTSPGSSCFLTNSGTTNLSRWSRPSCEQGSSQVLAFFDTFRHLTQIWSSILCSSRMHFSFMKQHLAQEPILRINPAFILPASDSGPFRLGVFLGAVLFV